MLVVSSFYCSGQEKDKARFRSLSGPEKCWVLFHPFVAKKAHRISLQAQKVGNKMLKDKELDADGNGGQVDAFRHAYWMAVIAEEIGRCRARKLGIAHERGNKRDFQKSRLEEGTLPDEASIEMDLFNNNIGIDIQKQNKEVDDKQLQDLIKEAVLSGRMRVIKKNDPGVSLDDEGKEIPEKEWQGKWENKRVLVPSDFKRPG